MFTSTNLFIQMRRSARLKKRLPKVSPIDAREGDTGPVLTTRTG
jgi:hypothetical protein